MEALKILVIFAITICSGNGFLLVHDAPRKVVKVLTVDNGGQWGDWHGPHFCADGTYAVGYNMKVSISPYILYSVAMRFCVSERTTLKQH